MTEKPLVSICIPNYNYACYLESCLESVLNQTYENIEVFLYDNQSTDNSYNIALSFREKFLEKGIFFSVVQNKYNVGSHKNSMLSGRDATGEFLYWLASDDIIEPTFIETCVDIFMKYPNVGTVITHRKEIDEKNNIYEEIPFYNQNCVIPGEEQAAVHMMAGIAIPGQRMVKRSILLKYDKFGGNFRVAGDWHSNFHFACMADVAYIKEPLFLYRVHSGNETSESELDLTGIFEHYQIINMFKDNAKALGLKKPVERYPEAVKKLSSMCIRYAHKMIKNDRNDIAKKYLQLAPVFDENIINEESYFELKNILQLDDKELRKKFCEWEERYTVKRTVSYDPPKGYILLD